VTLARDALALDDLSAGRLDLGLGPGSAGSDATALGQEAWLPSERMARFGEFLQVLRPIIDGAASTSTTMATAHYSAIAVPSTPGAVQSPLPLTIAAGGAKGLALAARYGQQWVTIGPTGAAPRTADSVLDAARRQSGELVAACRTGGRDPGTIGKVLLWTPVEPVLTSVDQFDELVGPYVELGFDQFVLHHPEQTGPYGGSCAVFERIASKYGTR
jgi:alkanesulfonate monooxygenase SsuD/methylene tetrahydromethanopterin reductase-like flavin-dependent oxidoreductase (luciferase family)